jgi:hypothetical protein
LTLSPLGTNYEHQSSRPQEQGMTNAGRATILPDEHEPIAPEVEALASAYLTVAEGNPSQALRLAAADRVADLERLQARVAQVQALVSRGFARWGQPRG